MTPSRQVALAALKAAVELLEQEEREIRLLTLDDCAARLACDEWTVRQLIKSGQLPAQRLGPRSPRVRDVDLDEYIAEGHRLGVRSRIRRVS